MTLNRLQSYVAALGTRIFFTNNNILFCKVSNTKISSKKRFSVTQYITIVKHLNTFKHTDVISAIILPTYEEVMRYYLHMNIYLNQILLLKNQV